MSDKGMQQKANTRLKQYYISLFILLILFLPSTGVISESETSIINPTPIIFDISINPTKVQPGDQMIVTASVFDPDGDKVSILFDWGDSTSSGWVGPFDTGEMFEVSYIWEEKGTYNIRIKAKDIGGTQSEWSDNFEVNIQREKKISKTETVQLAKKLIERFPNSKMIFSLPIFKRVFDYDVTDLISFDP
ncbi:MAG: PKD domain-containing protein [Thermoplasmatales archaeon]|nr:MAG: PKD domain-containing protein [Thermoplasmatales archaeon]